MSDETPLHKLAGYQRFLGELADALGYTGSATWDECIERVKDHSRVVNAHRSALARKFSDAPDKS